MQSTRIPNTAGSLPEEVKTQLGGMAADKDQNAHQQVDPSKTSSQPKTDTGQQKPKVSEKGEKLKKDLDKIIDEIDDVLEENAEEFIRSYVQRGGE